MFIVAFCVIIAGRPKTRVNTLRPIKWILFGRQHFFNSTCWNLIYRINTCGVFWARLGDFASRILLMCSIYLYFTKLSMHGYDILCEEPSKILRWKVYSNIESCDFYIMLNIKRVPRFKNSLICILNAHRKPMERVEETRWKLLGT